MIEPKFHMIGTNGVTLRTVVEGEGPLVILLHGWPQGWHLWRHQIRPLVEAGYRVVVPDMRGFGGSSAPAAIEEYNIRKMAGDVIGLARALGQPRFNLIAHDWGCIIGWNTALLHEDACKSIFGLSVPFWRSSPETLNPPGKDDRFWYIRYFQKPGVVEAELEKDVRLSLAKIYCGISAAVPALTWMKQLEYPAEGTGVLDILPTPKTLPKWLPEDALDYCVSQFRMSGFRGPCNLYRNLPTMNQLTPELEGKKIRQPAAFAVGTFDNLLHYDPQWQSWFPDQFEDLRFLEFVEGSGHWLQLEKTSETTALILRFLHEVEPL